LSKGPPEHLLLVGKVVRPHGLEGRLRVRSYARSEESFLAPATVFLKSGSGETREHTVLSVNPHKTVLLMELEGVNSLEEAEGYRGAQVFIRKDALIPLEEEEFFWHELIGLKVFLDTGQYLGTLRHILPTGGNDIYVVQEGEKEILIPAIHEVVSEIDLNNKRMIISEMEGLLDLNEV
jgi:16S rRNA processing protein RimM